MDTNKAQPGSEKYIPNAQQSDAPHTHLLHIYREGGMFSRDLIIMDSDKTTALYAVSHQPRSFRSRATTVVYRAQNPSQPVGIAVFSGLHGGNVDLQLHQRPVPFDRPPGILVRYEYTWQSGIGPLKWSSTSGFGRNLICVNERGEWLAKYETVMYAREKRGRLEVLNWDIQNGALD